MVKTHKRNKRTRIRGSRTMGTGFRKKKKGGCGNNGGQGWSGTGKRGSQKQQMALMYAHSLGYKTYFGGRGLTSAPSAKKRTQQIDLDDLKANYFKNENQKIEMKEYKILGEGNGFKAEIYAKAASKSAIEKMEKAGGKIIISDKVKIEKTSAVKKTEAPKTEVKEKAKPVEKKVAKKQ